MNLSSIVERICADGVTDTIKEDIRKHFIQADKFSTMDDAFKYISQELYLIRDELIYDKDDRKRQIKVAVESALRKKMENIDTNLVKLTLLKIKPSNVDLTKYSENEQNYILSILAKNNLIEVELKPVRQDQAQATVKAFRVLTLKGNNFLNDLEKDISILSDTYNEQEFEGLVKKYTDYE